MSVIVNICGMLIATANFPDATLQQFYQQYYHCEIKPTTLKDSSQAQSPHAITRLFPQPPSWWPIFTADQLSSDSFKHMIQHGIKPGVILPDKYFSVLDYIKIKEAVNQGAIPVVLYQIKHPKYFAAKATLSTALGLRPLAAFVETGWDENMIAQPAGSYIIQSDHSKSLNIPARQIQHHQHYFYQATIDPSQDEGYQVLINPPVDLPLEHIQYPQLGISWKFNQINYQSTPEHVKTSLAGYVLIAASIVILPLDYIFSFSYPSLLSSFGSSISWVSLVLGGFLLLLLIISIIRRGKAHARD